MSCTPAVLPQTTDCYTRPGGPAQAVFNLQAMRNEILRMHRDRTTDQANTQQTLFPTVVRIQTAPAQRPLHVAGAGTAAPSHCSRLSLQQRMKRLTLRLLPTLGSRFGWLPRRASWNKLRKMHRGLTWNGARINNQFIWPTDLHETAFETIFIVKDPHCIIKSCFVFLIPDSDGAVLHDSLSVYEKTL